MRKVIVIALSLGALGFLLLCQHKLDNPLDPQSDSYVGDRSANDHTPPAIILPDSIDNQTVYSDSVTLSGTLDDDNPSALLINGILVPVENGTWQMTAYLNPGANEFVIQAKDSSIHENASSDTVVILREVPPDQPTNIVVVPMGENIRITWQDRSINETGFVLERSMDNTIYEVLDTLPADSTSYLDTLGLVPFRKYYYRVAAVGNAGLSAVSLPNVILYEGIGWTDSIAPIISIVSPMNNQSVNTEPLLVQVSAEDGSGIKFLFINDSAAVLAGSWWEAALPLDSGINTITVRAADNSKRANACTTSIQVIFNPTVPDLEAPSITFIWPPDFDTISIDSVDVVVHAVDPAGISSVSLNGNAMPVSSGYHSLPVMLDSGMNFLVIRASDAVGNVAHDTLHLFHAPAAVDNTPPVLTITSPQHNSRITANAVVVSGTAMDAGGIDSVLVNGVAASLSPPNWQATVTLKHGPNRIRVRAVDASDSANETLDSVTVTQNRAPIFAGKADTTVIIGIYSTTIAATDPDGDVVIFEPLLLPAGVDLVMLSESTAVIDSFAPTATGTTTFSVLAKDAYEGYDTLQWRITVVLPDQNAEPEFTTPPGTIPPYVLAGRLYSVDIDATDPDGDPLTFSFATNPSGMTINSASGLVTWSPGVKDTGTHQVIVWVSDGTFAVQMSWTVTVNMLNRPPVMAALPDTAIDEGQALTLTVSAADSDGNTIAFSMPSFPTGARLQNRVFTWTPTTAQAGQYTVVFVATDNGMPPLSDTETVNITVNNLTGGPPVFSTTPANMKDSADEAAVYRDTVLATVSDSSSITYAKIAGPAGVQINPATGIVTFTPTVADSGSQTIAVTAANPLGQKDTLTWQVHVRAWGFLGSPGLSAGRADFVSMCIDSTTGTIYIGYRDGGFANKATVMRYAGSAWNPLGSQGFSRDSVSYLSLTAANSKVYVSYRDPQRGGNPTVQLNTGAGWDTVGTTGFGSEATYTSIAVHNDVPYVAYVNPASTNGMVVRRFTGGGWSSRIGNTQIGSAQFTQCGFPTIVSNSGNLSLAFRAGSRSGAATAFNLSGNSWAPIGTNPSNGTGANFPMLSADNGTPYLAYQDVANGNRATVRRYASGGWSTVGSAGFTASAADYTSVRVWNNIPHVAFKDAASSGKVTVMRYMGSAWSTLGRAGISEGSSDYVCLFIHNGIPYVAFADQAQGNRLSVMRYK